MRVECGNREQAGNKGISGTGKSRNKGREA